MAYPHPLTPQEALIYVMVLAAAVDRDMSEAELKEIGKTVGLLPIFSRFDREQLIPVAKTCSDALNELGENGFQELLKEIRAALPERLHETAYALAVDVAVADLSITNIENKFLGMLANALNIDILARVAIERAARARHMPL